MRPPHPHLPLTLLLLTSCATPPTNRLAESAPVSAPIAPASIREESSGPGSRSDDGAVEEFALPEGWRVLGREEFAVALEGWLDGKHAVRVEDRALVVLEGALGSGDESSVRAAAMLARSLDPRAGEALLARLERRVDEPARSPAGDLVAAAAFSRGATARDAAARLEALASGRAAHPVLDVRLECAASALALGRDGSIAFLLDLLREGTSFATSKPDWKRIDWTTARLERAQRRAAAVLSARAGIQATYRVEASMAAREAEVTRLAQLLGSAGRPKK
jgi:hypothetical protein